MLATLRGYLPVPVPPLPSPGASAVEVRRSPVGIGNWRGIEHRGAIGEIALKGGRLDAVVRFQVWAGSVGEVDALIDTLQGDLLADADSLRAAGFLRVGLKDSAPAEFIGGTTNAWRRTCDLAVLYEYHYQDTDGAESLIARIPILSDLEQRDSPVRETATVTDQLVRWDSLEARPLVVSGTARRSLRVYGLASLAYRPPAWTGSQVVVSRVQRDDESPPTVYPTWAEFLAAVTDEAAPDRHAQVTFASFSDFLAAFDAAGDPVELGDWDEDGLADSYVPGVIAFETPIVLGSGSDVLSITYQGSTFDFEGVAYLRIGIHR